MLGHSRQQAKKWCWAAAAEITMAFLGVPDPASYRQCNQVDSAFSKKQKDRCCTDPLRYSWSTCNIAHYPQWHLYRVRHIPVREAPIPFAVLQNEISQRNRPVVVSLNLERNRPHFVVVYGYTKSAAGTLLYLRDPEGMLQAYSYSEWLKSQRADMVHYHGLEYVR